MMPMIVSSQQQQASRETASANDNEDDSDDNSSYATSSLYSSAITNYTNDCHVSIDTNDLCAPRGNVFNFRNFAKSVNPPTDCTQTHSNFYLLLILGTYVISIPATATWFMYIEQPKEMEMKNQLIRRQQAFLAKFPCVDVGSLNDLLSYVTDNRGIYSPLSESYFERSDMLSLKDSKEVFLKKESQKETTSEIFNPRDYRPTGYHSNPEPWIGEKLLEPKSDSKDSFERKKPIFVPLNYSTALMPSNWEWSNSFLFVISIATTIGYGHVTPQTELGKVSCMIYGTIGVPLTFILISAIVTLLLQGPARKIEYLILWILTNLFRSSSLFLIRFMHLFLITSIFFVICFFLPAYLFMKTEVGWTYLDSLYYCFISLTTIGLGDLVPNTVSSTQKEIYTVFTVVYLYFGLTFVMLLVALVYRIPQFNLNKLLVQESKETDVEDTERLRILQRKCQSKSSWINGSKDSTPKSQLKSYGTPMNEEKIVP